MCMQQCTDITKIISFYWLCDYSIPLDGPFSVCRFVFVCAHTHTGIQDLLYHFFFREQSLAKIKRAKRISRHCLFISIFSFGCRLFKTIYKIKRIKYTNVLVVNRIIQGKCFANICPLYLWLWHLPFFHDASVCFNKFFFYKWIAIKI